MTKIKSINNLNELVTALRVSDGFLTTVTLREGDQLHHFLLMKNFIKLDMLKSLKEAKDLVIKHLETADIDDTVSLDNKALDLTEDVDVLDIESIGEDDAQDTK